MPLRNARIELHSGPDDMGRYSYTLLWIADYPKEDTGSCRRAQCFFADPKQHGLPKHRIIDKTKDRK